MRWELSSGIELGGTTHLKQIAREDAERQERTARGILEALSERPGIVLADEVGMGKTYVALAVVASILEQRGRRGAPVVVMVPPGLLQKWRREWKQFRNTCAESGRFHWVRDEYAYETLDFIRLVQGEERADLVWATTTCFSRERRDPWVELAMIRWALTTMRIDAGTRASLCKWVPELLRQGPRSGLTRDVMARLLARPHEEWHKILVEQAGWSPDSRPPLPAALLKARVDPSTWTDLRDFLRNSVPGYKGAPSDGRVAEAGNGLRKICRSLLAEVLANVPWNSPLLVLDEAHHAKNDRTKLAGLFRSELLGNGESQHRPRLVERFDRMLFLTATPFQLGHSELIRILRSFAAVRWQSSNPPGRSRDEFVAEIDLLAERLSASRAAARALDRAWGRLSWESAVGQEPPEGDGEAALQRWWAAVERAPRNELERDLRECVGRCRAARDLAEADARRPWASLRTWVLRNNRPTKLSGEPPCERRVFHLGQAIREPGASSQGLALTSDVALPFLLAARAQGALAAVAGHTALFAHGLASSYEAFHHTREPAAPEPVVDQETDAMGPTAEQDESSEKQDHYPGTPVEWFLGHIEREIPSRLIRPTERVMHPKVRATVERVVDLWTRGEKVLVFAFYRQTVLALGEHISEEIDRRTCEMVATKLKAGTADARRWLGRAVRNVSRKESLLRRAIEEELLAVVRNFDAELLRPHEARVVGWLSTYIRSQSSLARILPLERPEVRSAFEEDQTRAIVFQRAARAFRETIENELDGSGQTFRDRVNVFLRFAQELALRTQREISETEGSEEEAADPLEEYFGGVETHLPGRGDWDDAQTRVNLSGRAGPRMADVVRFAHGGTPRATRERLMWAFNSPIFPEVLVSSRVLGEGVDLHRFCRFVVHHDLDWNPSVLEQRNGRVDRIHCKAEQAGAPIELYQPFIAGGADEKMFRVVKDRERWFQIVMGQDYKLDEASTEKLARRVPLPVGLAGELVFRLAP